MGLAGCGEMGRWGEGAWSRAVDEVEATSGCDFVHGMVTD